MGFFESNPLVFVGVVVLIVEVWIRVRAVLFAALRSAPLRGDHAIRGDHANPGDHAIPGDHAPGEGGLPRP